ncbi:MAG: M3 family oligoendopeptidase [Bacteroidetes bacterium]|nr:M3 family oligoendopeptidase [Bacteroidota bacterium]
MRFSEMPYRRPDFVNYQAEFNTTLHQFMQAASEQEQLSAFDKIYALRREFETMMTLASIRNSLNTSDSFYEAEQNFFDENEPHYKKLVTSFYRVLLQAPFRDGLEARYGNLLFQLAALSLKTFDDCIIEDLQKENTLSTEYTKLIASAKIEFDGQIYNLSGLAPFKLSPDREIRIKASEKYDAFFAANKVALDRIFDEMVKLRHQMAIKLGFNNFIELGYARMSRTDYTAADVKRFRDAVLEQLVPISQELKARQQERLGLGDFKYYDEPLDYPGGNPQPQGSPEWIVQHAATMYKELSPATDEFFQFMQKNELMDLINKPDKAGGGYCTFLSGYQAPFIFSNFNGTSHDIDVLTHEAGHAFQCYRSRYLGIEEYYFPTLEACEIHSMSMEFLTWPWMHLFFNEHTDKYKFSHLSRALTFIPYGCAVDEFQHWIYENPHCTPDERHNAFRTIEKKYLPHRDYAENNYMESGGFWQRQSHIYRSPFYYIDYTLAQLCAFQFWYRSQSNREEALNDYIVLCDQGGSKSFLELVKVAKLHSPFDPNTIKTVAGQVKKWLTEVPEEQLS